MLLPFWSLYQFFSSILLGHSLLQRVLQFPQIVCEKANGRRENWEQSVRAKLSNKGRGVDNIQLEGRYKEKCEDVCNKKLLLNPDTVSTVRKLVLLHTETLHRYCMNNSFPIVWEWQSDKRWTDTDNTYRTSSDSQ